MKDEALRYIGNDYGKCLYLYIDLIKYGLENENINMWCQKKEGKIQALVFSYYNGAHVFSKDEVFDAEDVADCLKKLEPAMICGMETVIDKVHGHMGDGYAVELGKVAELTDFRALSDGIAYQASLDEIKEVAELLSTDEALGKPYGYDLLYRQLTERYQENFGRNYIYRVDGRVAATASTYAETDELCVISGVMVDKEYRGRKLSEKVLAAICGDLKSEGKRVFSYYYIQSAMKMHRAVGFTEIGTWAKLIRE